MSNNTLDICKYFKCFDKDNKPNGLKFGVDVFSRVKDNPKIELCILQSCFGHLDAVIYLLDNGFEFVGNYIGCGTCSSIEKGCGGCGKIWRKGNIYIGGCNGCGFVKIMKRLN